MPLNLDFNSVRDVELAQLKVIRAGGEISQSVIQGKTRFFMALPENCGIKIWGYVDFLQKYCRHIILKG